jgi:hypothetical protein
MPASGILVDAVNAVKTQLTALSLVPITDPRNARPMSVLIELANGYSVYIQRGRHSTDAPRPWHRHPATKTLATTS